MIKVLIADDEIRVCNLIRALVDWQSLDMSVVGVAHNGMDALHAVEEEKPDLVITDIRMPSCTGLELVEQTRKLCPSIRFIIISGYTQFEYAQLAIKFGVSDYLLKPIDKQELMTTLRRVKAEIEAHQREQALSDKMRRAFFSDQHKVRACYLMDILGQRRLPEALEQVNREYRFSFRPGLFQGFAVKLDYLPEACDAAALATVCQRVREIFLGHLRGLCMESELWFENGLGVGICNFRQDNAGRIRSCLNECLRELQIKQETFPPIVFTVSAAPLVTDADIAQTVLTARRILDERLVSGSRKVLDSLTELSGISILDVASDFVRRVRPALEQADETAVKMAVNWLQERVMQEPGITGREILKLVTLAGEKVLEENALTEQYETLASGFSAGCQICATADHLFGHMQAFVCKLSQMLWQGRLKDKAMPMRQAQIFLEQHYTENISLEQVAGMVGFNPSYFSVLFKKECGVGFQDYLTSIRINHAKELLMQTTEPISEICYRVGYKDVKHFNKVFKKATNLRPSEFKKLYGR